MGCFPARKPLKINTLNKDCEGESAILLNNQQNKILIKELNLNFVNVKEKEKEKKEFEEIDSDRKKKKSVIRNLKSIESSGTRRISTIKNFKLTVGLMVGDSGSDPFMHYEKQELLGEGSFGTVYRVIHKQTGFIRAMKIIDKQSTELDQDTEISLINEINILKTLDHPNIIKVFEYFNTQRRLFIISELCTGGELFDKITKEEKFSEKVTANIMKQVLSAISFCHLNKVIHRDLKPENILIVSEKESLEDLFEVKIIDFGTSDKIKNKTMLTLQIGTSYYIAPEVLESNYNEKCDLWSCGVIMYILLCGTPPFFAGEENEIFDLIKEGKYSFRAEDWEDVSEEAKDLIRHLLKRDISMRFSAQQALSHVWLKNMDVLLKKDRNVSKKKIVKVAENLKVFSANKKLQQATLAYIVHNMLKKEETDEFRKIFTEFDLNGDGRLTKEELIKGLIKVMTPEEAKKEVGRIIGIIDVDGNGFIEYEEFLRAAMNKERILTEKNLQAVFNMFDKDRSGKISIKEIRDILGGQGELKISNDVWSHVVSEMDGNGDGEVEFKEFKAMMNKLLDSPEIVRNKKKRITGLSMRQKIKFNG